jgi:hypothetical protein
LATYHDRALRFLSSLKVVSLARRVNHPNEVDRVLHGRESQRYPDRSNCEHGILFTVEGNKGGFPAPVRVFDYVVSRIDRLLGFGRVP